MLPWCSACARRCGTRATCARRASDSAIEWRPAAGTGVVYAFSVHHLAGPGREQVGAAVHGRDHRVARRRAHDEQRRRLRRRRSLGRHGRASDMEATFRRPQPAPVRARVNSPQTRSRRTSSTSVRTKSSPMQSTGSSSTDASADREAVAVVESGPMLSLAVSAKCVDRDRRLFFGRPPRGRCPGALPQEPLELAAAGDSEPALDHDRGSTYEAQDMRAPGRRSNAARSAGASGSSRRIATTADGSTIISGEDRVSS